MFICTHDEKLIEKFKQYNYPLIRTQKVGEHTVFIFKNLNRLVFSLDEKKKFVLTNRLFL